MSLDWTDPPAADADAVRRSKCHRMQGQLAGFKRKGSDNAKVPQQGLLSYFKALIMKSEVLKRFFYNFCK